MTPAPGPYPVPTGGVPPLSESLRAAFGKRDELRAQDASIREGEAAADSARSEFAPTFFGQGGYSYETNDLNPHKSVFSILLGGKVNLFSGFADEASLRQARLAVHHHLLTALEPLTDHRQVANRPAGRHRLHLATHLSGKSLPVEHGAPLRLLVPMKLGLKNIKAITSITYSLEEPADYWNERGYSKYDGL